MAITTKRRFTDEFKREAVTLWETSGRMQNEVAAELGIMPTMLGRWQRKLQESSASSASPAAKPSGAPWFVICSQCLCRPSGHDRRDIVDEPHR